VQDRSKRPNASVDDCYLPKISLSAFFDKVAITINYVYGCGLNYDFLGDLVDFLSLFVSEFSLLLVCFQIFLNSFFQFFTIGFAKKD
jgi:hypothetical protein